MVGPAGRIRRSRHWRSAPHQADPPLRSVLEDPELQEIDARLRGVGRVDVRDGNLEGCEIGLAACTGRQAQRSPDRSALNPLPCQECAPRLELGVRHGRPDPSDRFHGSSFDSTQKCLHRFLRRAERVPLRRRRPRVSAASRRVTTSRSTRLFDLNRDQPGRPCERLTRLWCGKRRIGCVIQRLRPQAVRPSDVNRYISGARQALTIEKDLRARRQPLPIDPDGRGQRRFGDNGHCG
jgi:hypothetical protein